MAHLYVKNMFYILHKRVEGGYRNEIYLGSQVMWLIKYLLVYEINLSPIY